MRIALRLALVLLALAGPALGQLELRFLDVGQGDAILIRDQSKAALIDAGRGQEVVSQIRANGVYALDLAVATHAHADHIGGMPAVLQGMSVRYYMDNGMAQTTATYLRTMGALKASGAQYLRPTERTIALGAAKLRVLPPPPGARSQNDASVGLLVEYGEFRALLTGDSDAPELQSWLHRFKIPKVQVLKVAHHGSWNGTTQPWVAATRPDVAVISVGNNNSYGHPAPSVVAEWQKAGARVHRTDSDGTIIVRANLNGSFELATQGRLVQAPDVSALVPQAPAKPEPSARGCCKVCSRGEACGDTCISRSYACHQPPGCACDAQR
jgi:beta-lactamase superfamily II metal-dependent hydrolase